MTSKKLLMIIGLAVLIVWAVIGLLGENGKRETSVMPRPITIYGEITCLPKTGSGPQTMECAIGLAAEDGKYYGLKNLTDVDAEYRYSQTGTKVRVSGMLTEDRIKGPDGNQYAIFGTINIEAIDRSDL